MSKHLGGLALILGVALVAGAARPDDDDDKKMKEEIKKAQKDVVDLAADLEAGKDVTKKVEAIKKKYEDLNTLMHVYKPRDKGGLGYGPKKIGDGIELKILDLGKRALSKMALDKEQGDLVKMAYINIALAKISHAYTPAKPKGGKGPKDWKGYADDMEKASKDLIGAAKKGDAKLLKSAASNLNTSCNSCHSDFRDSN